MYLAPEIILTKVPIRPKIYNEKVDMWSLGVILFILLGGKQPFNANRQGRDTDKDLLKQIIDVDVYYDDVWSNISASAKNLVEGLLVRKPEKRLSADDALKHPWLSTEHADVKRAKELIEEAVKSGQYTDRPKRAYSDNSQELELVTNENFDANIAGSCPKRAKMD